jgi:hypothetical protein
MCTDRLASVRAPRFAIHEYTSRCDQRFSVGGANVQRSVVVSNAFRASREQRLFIACPALIDARTSATTIRC